MAKVRADQRGDEKVRATVWAWVRSVCDKLDGAVEAPSFGNPAFRVGVKRRPFVVLDIYRGESCLWVRVDPGRRSDLLADPAYFPAPYDRTGVALCRRLPGLRRREFKSLILYSYVVVK